MTSISNGILNKEPPCAEPHAWWCERPENESRKKTTSFSSYSISGLPTAMAFILFHSLFYLPGILPFLFRRFRPIQPCDLLGNYFAAKVTDSPSLCQCRQAAAGVSRENLPLRCRAYFPVQPWPGVPADFSEQKNNSRRPQTGRTEGRKIKG